MTITESLKQLNESEAKNAASIEAYRVQNALREIDLDLSQQESLLRIMANDIEMALKTIASARQTIAALTD